MASVMALGWRVSEGLGEPATEPDRLPRRGRPLAWPPGLADSLGDTEDSVGDESTRTGPTPLPGGAEVRREDQRLRKCQQTDSFLLFERTSDTMFEVFLRFLSSVETSGFGVESHRQEVLTP